MNEETIEILLVEDSPTDAFLVREELSQVTDGPFVITHVERLTDAIDQLRTHRFDLVLLDLSLPDCDGFETFVQLSAATADVPVVVLSVRADVTLAVRAVQAGAQDYLVKGHMEEQFLARSIRNAIARKRSDGEFRRLSEVLEQKNVELTARNEELLWKTALFEAKANASIDGILVVNERGKKIFQNQRMNDLWEISHEMAEDPDDSRQVAWVAQQNRDPEQFMARVGYLYAHPDEIGRDEIELRNGKIFDRYSAPVLDKFGHSYGRIWTFRDVTEARSRESSLAAALAREQELTNEARAGDRAKSEFLAAMSHEIRTPMNAILGFSEVLNQASNLPADCRDYVQTISSSGEALLRILNDVLDFSQLEAKGLKVEKTDFSPREVLQNVLALLGPRAAEKGLKFSFCEAEEGPERLWGDAGRLHQVLLNLASNAIKFTEKGAVTLGLGMSDSRPNGAAGSVDFFVRDTGPGIPEAKLSDIFEPFRQLDSSISRRHGGTGLGLSISRDLVELMGGRLTVRSQLGAGSDFRVTLPNVAPEVASAEPPPPPADLLNEMFAARHPLRLMLVEDDPVNRKLMLLVLRKLGYEALVAQDGVEAVEVYRRELPDCILMDLQMPRQDGLETTVEIRRIEREAATKRHVFIAAVTANIVEEDRLRCFEHGMDAYLNKPLKRAALAKTLMQASE